MSFQPLFQLGLGQNFLGNKRRFATSIEAHEYATIMMYRNWRIHDFRVIVIGDEPNCRWNFSKCCVEHLETEDCYED